MSAFAKHRIDHLSGAQVNLWIADPQAYACRYLAGFKDSTSPKMARGTAAEHGLKRILHGGSMDEALADAQATYEQETHGEVSEEIAKVAQGIPAMIEQGRLWAEENKLIGQLASHQLPVNTWVKGVPIPFVGYKDFTFLCDCPDTDMKTTERLQLQRSHVRQIAIYYGADQRPQSLLYVSPKKYQHIVISPEELESALDEVREAAVSLERFLSKVDDAGDALSILPVNPDSFRMSKELIEARNNLLGAA